MPDTSVLSRLIRWIEREAHLLGADIEVEVQKILEKLADNHRRKL